MAGRLERFIVILVLTIFAGSIFITSGKFIDSEITPKLYFTIGGVILITLLSVMMTSNDLYLRCLNKGHVLLKGFFLISTVQSLYGLLQYISVFPSNHSAFLITGSFDNPAGLSSVLSLCFPIGLFLCLTTEKFEQKMYILSNFIVCFAVVLSGSRSGIITLITSSLTLLVIYSKNVKRMISKKRIKCISIVVLFIILLYFSKIDSAKSRIYIWNITSEIIKDKCVFGYGYGKFKAVYMDYQAEFFISNPDSDYKFLADNINHPFNEFLNLFVEFGLFGIIVFFLLLTYWIKKVIKSTSPYKALSISGMTALFTFSMFSYPLQYPSTWLLFVLYVFIPLRFRCFCKYISILFKIVLAIVCLICVIYFLHQMKAEIKWKEVVNESFDNNANTIIDNYSDLKTVLKNNPYFLYNYAAELKNAEKYTESIKILEECKNRLNDFDVQMLLADNYYKIGKMDLALEKYIYASNMIPCRFIPLYNIFEIYKETNQKGNAMFYAKKITEKQVKINSFTVKYIKEQAKKYVDTQNLPSL